MFISTPFSKVGNTFTDKPTIDPTPVRFDYTGAPYEYNIPTGLNYIEVDCVGAFGGGSGAAISITLILTKGIYEYCCPGGTGVAGYWYSGGSGHNAYFRMKNTLVYNFEVGGGQGDFGRTSNSGGSIISFVDNNKLVTQTIKTAGNSASGWSNQAGYNARGGNSVYPIDGINYGMGGYSTAPGGIQGFLRLIFLK